MSTYQEKRQLEHNWIDAHRTMLRQHYGVSDDNLSCGKVFPNYTTVWTVFLADKTLTVSVTTEGKISETVKEDVSWETKVDELLKSGEIANFEIGFGDDYWLDEEWEGKWVVSIDSKYSRPIIKGVGSTISEAVLDALECFEEAKEEK
jgi:hypothetical protein